MKQITSRSQIYFELFYEQNKKTKSNKQYKEPRVVVDALFKKLKDTIMQSDQVWTHIKKKLDIKEGGQENITQVESITFNEFLRLLDQESYFRDIMFEYQLFYKSTKRLRFSREIHLTNRRQGQYGDKAIKGIPNSLQAAHLIDHIVFFESNGIQLLICGFENKDVHAIDYASGDIVFEFIFKDEPIPPTNQLEQEGPLSPAQQQSMMRRTQTFRPNQNSTAQKIVRYQFSQSLKKNGVMSPEDLIAIKPAKKEILGSLKTNIAKKLADTVEDTLAADYGRPNSPPNKNEKDGSSPQKKYSQTATNSPTRKKRQAISSTSQQRQRYFGILGLDPIREEENKLGSYKTVLSSQPSKQGGKVVLKREYTYGLDERLFTSEFEREKIKAKFGNFMKLVDLDIKMNEKYAGDIRAHKQKINAISSLFGSKKALHGSEEQQTNNAAMELEAAIDKIIKQQSQRKQDEERYQGQLQYFNMVDNEETQKLLKTLDKLSAKSQVVQGKAKRLNNLNERGQRHIQVLKDAENGTSKHQHHIGKKEPNNEHFTNKISDMLSQSYVAQTQTAAALKAAASLIPISNAQFESSDTKTNAKNSNVIIDCDKVSYPICIQHFKPLDLIAFALVNRQLQIYTIRQTVAKLLFEKRAKHSVILDIFKDNFTIKTEQMAVCMSVEQHKVTDRLLCCVGFQYDLIQVHEFNHNKDYSTKYNQEYSHKILVSMLSPYSQVTNTLYIRELGLITTTYTGYMEIFENCDFRSIWSNKAEMNEGKGRGPMSLTLLDFIVLPIITMTSIRFL